MSFKHFNDRVKQTQKIIDEYLGTDVALGTHDTFTMIDSLRVSLGYTELFGQISENDYAQPGFAASLTDKFLAANLTEIGTRSAIVGDISALQQDDSFILGVVLGHDYSLFVGSENKFGLVSNRTLTKAWRIGGEN